MIDILFIKRSKDKRKTTSSIVSKQDDIDFIVTCCHHHSLLSGDSHPTTVWASGNNDSWGHLKHGFNGLTNHFSQISDKAAQWVRNILIIS